MRIQIELEKACSMKKKSITINRMFIKTKEYRHSLESGIVPNACESCKGDPETGGS